MAGNDAGEKTEEPTQQRRDDFRKRGQVAQTKELGSVLSLGLTLLFLLALGHYYIVQGTIILEDTVQNRLVEAARTGDWIPATYHIFVVTAVGLLPILLAFWIFGLFSSVVQVGFLYNEEALELKWERLDPVQGLMRIFSWKALVEGLKATLKVVLIGIVVYFVLRDELNQLPLASDYSIEQQFWYFAKIAGKVLSGVLALMVALAGLDYFFQRWDLEREMRMTKQEVKEELKSREGDPLIKSRIRRVQRQLAQKRMMEDVPKADVVVTNPTHIAVALKYDDTMVAPRVVAMGADLIAEKIKRIATESKVPIVENKPLARAIFKTLKVGQMIPRELYTAVAEVLSYVYRLKNDWKGRV